MVLISKLRFERMFLFGSLLITYLSSFMTGCSNKSGVREVGLGDRLQKISVESNTTFDADISEYALLINGTFKEEFIDNLFIAYNSLLSVGYKPENIFIISPHDPRPLSQVKGNYWLAKPSALEKVVSVLKRNVDSNDILFVYMTGDGINEKGHSRLLLGDIFDLRADYFSKNLLEIGFGNCLCVFGQCYSGGFGKELLKQAKQRGLEVTIGTSIDESRPVWGRTYNREFFRSFNENDADRNRDGVVSFEEAHQAATEKVKQVFENEAPAQTQTQYSSTSPNEEHMFVK